jgi:hypothetical protein
MVQLDHQLLYSANRLFDGTNAHRLRELIFAYEFAVDLHNRQLPGYEIYRIQSEMRLRNYVHRCQGEALRCLADAARQLALNAQARFDSI